MHPVTKNNIMARPQKEKRESSFVTLRKKSVSKGRQSYYLDIYKDGKRSYEFLKLYLVPEDGKRYKTMVIKPDGSKEEATVTAKTLNKNTEQAAKAIRNQRELDIIQGKGGIKKYDKGGKMLLQDWLEICSQEAEKNGQSNSVALNIRRMAKHAEAYKENTKLSDIDEEWCKGFIRYLSHATARSTTKNKKKLSHSTASIYFNLFSTTLSLAAKQKVIPANPVKNLATKERKPIKANGSNRPFLTGDEVKQLIETDCRYIEVKRAFLFACFTGLRISDVIKLKWTDVNERDGFFYISVVMKKTGRALPELKLNSQAQKWMPEKGKDIYVFDLPCDTRNINRIIKTWAKKAGITKDICFHVSRHTFATMALSKGTSIYVVGNILGHENISTTQIYADIISKDRDEALDNLADGF